MSGRSFRTHAGAVDYTARNKPGHHYLGRFTFDTILDFEGLNRVLTTLARGFLFHNENGSPVKAPRERIDYAKRGLCAWCSVPSSKKATPREAWQFGSDFGKLHGEFPGLVEENGSGWFHRHVHRVADFVRKNPKRVSSSAQKKCAAIEKGLTGPAGQGDPDADPSVCSHHQGTVGPAVWTVFWPRLWSWGHSGRRNRYFHPHWWSNFAASRLRAFPWRWWRRWRPTTLQQAGGIRLGGAAGGQL